LIRKKKQRKGGNEERRMKGTMYRRQARKQNLLQGAAAPRLKNLKKDKPAERETGKKQQNGKAGGN